MLALTIALIVIDYSRGHLDWSKGFFVVLMTLNALLLMRRYYVVFYETGIHFPAHSKDLPDLFIRWSDIGRYHWEGDMLTVVQTVGLLGGGVSASSFSGSVRVPASRRAQVENLLERATSPTGSGKAT